MTAAQPTTLYSRHEHGGHRVLIHEHGSRGGCQYEVSWPHGSETYGSARSLMRALYSGGDGSTGARDPGISLKRYFRLGGAATQGGVLDLLGVPVPPVPSVKPVRSSRRRPRQSAARVRRVAQVTAPWWSKPLDLAVGEMLKPMAWVNTMH
jgi:hypothetical protein